MSTSLKQPPHDAHTTLSEFSASTDKPAETSAPWAPQESPQQAERNLPLLRVGKNQTALPWQTANDLMLVEQIGVGGMGVVHNARQSALHREVAVKVSHDPGPQSKSYRSVLREAQILGQLDHPNIAPIHMVGHDHQDRMLIVMKRIEGSALSEMLQDPHHPRWKDVTSNREAWLLRVLTQVCYALEHAHSKNILHRDVKADNVMIGDHGRVYLIDWGISVVLDKDGTYLAPHFAGTPCQAAPEMVQAPRLLTTRTDVYMLGAILHEVLTGEPPHNAQDFDACLKLAVLEPNTPYSGFTDRNLIRICRQALQIDPAERFESVAHFRHALEDHLAQQHVRLLLSTAMELRSQLQTMHTQEMNDAHQLHALAIQCRFAFEQAARAGASTDLVNRGLSDCLIVQLLHALGCEAFNYAKVHLDELIQLGNIPDDELMEFRMSIEQGETTARLRKDELNVQIQYRLLARLEEAEAELDSTAFLKDFTASLAT